MQVTSVDSYEILYPAIEFSIISRTIEFAYPVMQLIDPAVEFP